MSRIETRVSLKLHGSSHRAGTHQKKQLLFSQKSLVQMHQMFSCVVDVLESWPGYCRNGSICIWLHVSSAQSRIANRGGRRWLGGSLMDDSAYCLSVATRQMELSTALYTRLSQGAPLKNENLTVIQFGNGRLGDDGGKWKHQSAFCRTTGLTFMTQKCSAAVFISKQTLKSKFKLSQHSVALDKSHDCLQSEHELYWFIWQQQTVILHSVIWIRYFSRQNFNTQQDKRSLISITVLKMVHVMFI